MKVNLTCECGGEFYAKGIGAKKAGAVWTRQHPCTKRYVAPPPDLFKVTTTTVKPSTRVDNRH